MQNGHSVGEAVEKEAGSAKEPIDAEKLSDPCCAARQLHDLVRVTRPAGDNERVRDCN